MPVRSAYIHIPFCAHKCSYCDFNAFSGLDSWIPQLTDAIVSDIDLPAGGGPLSTVFFGGGTPTRIPAQDIGRILIALRGSFGFDADVEVSCEANPGSSDAERFESLRDAGVNRISIGVQSFDDTLLSRLERQHSSQEAVTAIQTAQSSGFDSISLDLMFGLPGQTMEVWLDTLERAIALGTDHLSVYGLTIEPGTRFDRLLKGGKLELPEEDLTAEMMVAAMERLPQAGLQHYEISNYARTGHACRHNLVYWRNEEYMAFGPGAVSYVDGARSTREKYPPRYIQRLSEAQDPIVERERPDSAQSQLETFMLGIRLRDGLDLAAFEKRHRLKLQEACSMEIEALRSKGLIECTSNHMLLTDRGVLFANDVILYLAGSPGWTGTV